MVLQNLLSIFQVLPMAGNCSWFHFHQSINETLVLDFVITQTIYYCTVDKASTVLLFSLGLHPWDMEVPRLGVELEVQLPAYATATATRDPSCVCDLHCSSWQSQISKPLNEARDQIHILMGTSWIRLCCATMGTPLIFFEESYFLSLTLSFSLKYH